MSDLLRATLQELQRAIDKGDLPENWTITDPPDRDVEDGYIFLRQGGIITGCIIDVATHKRARTEGKGPLTLAKFSKPPGPRWVVLCDADTPEQVVSAFINYLTFGEFT